MEEVVREYRIRGASPFSRDGREWRQVWGLPSLEGMDLVFGAGRFVAVGVDKGVAVLATSP